MSVGGVLLTGGASRRMGFDKATIVVGGIRLAARLGAELEAVCAPALEVGPGVSGLAVVVDEGGGPLVAFGAGVAELDRLGFSGDVLLFACDLPFADRRVMSMLATWPHPGSVVPVVAGRPQPLAARWSAEHLVIVGELVSAGERSLRALVELSGVILIDEGDWSPLVSAEAFWDVDTPEDIERLGLKWSKPE